MQQTEQMKLKKQQMSTIKSTDKNNINEELNQSQAMDKTVSNCIALANHLHVRKPVQPSELINMH
jgi:hypothetical protein